MKNKHRPRCKSDPGETTCYAESSDGIEWTFPNLGLFEVNGTTENNAVLAGMPPFSHNFFVRFVFFVVNILQ